MWCFVNETENRCMREPEIVCFGSQYIENGSPFMKCRKLWRHVLRSTWDIETKWVQGRDCSNRFNPNWTCFGVKANCIGVLSLSHIMVSQIACDVQNISAAINDRSRQLHYTESIWSLYGIQVEVPQRQCTRFKPDIPLELDIAQCERSLLTQYSCCHTFKTYHNCSVGVGCIQYEHWTYFLTNSSRTQTRILQKLRSYSNNAPCFSLHVSSFFYPTIDSRASRTSLNAVG